MASKKKVLGTKQTNISSFFSPPSQQKQKKRTASETETETETRPCKVTKEDMDNEKKETVVEISSPSTEVVQHKSPSAASDVNTVLNGMEETVVKIDLGCSDVDIGLSWREALNSEFEKDYFKRLSVFLGEERKTKKIFPPENEVFSWTTLHNIRKTKVVIIGQDPYHGPQQAHGLCFSVQIGIPPPPSLKNIYKELNTDIEGFTTPTHGHLIGWSSQGVLLLNACLTVVASKANSHKDRGWEKFTDATIKWLNTNTEGVVFILWGNYAQKKGKSINKARHLVLSGKHPSPLSAHGGFFGCKHFSKANAYLKEKGKKEIDWNYLPESL